MFEKKSSFFHFFFIFNIMNNLWILFHYFSVSSKQKKRGKNYGQTECVCVCVCLVDSTEESLCQKKINVTKFHIENVKWFVFGCISGRWLYFFYFIFNWISIYKHWNRINRQKNQIKFFFPLFFSDDSFDNHIWLRVLAPFMLLLLLLNDYFFFGIKFIGNRIQ